MAKRNYSAMSNNTIQTGQHFMLVNAPGSELIESRAFNSAERRTEVRMQCKKTLEYFCANESWGTVTQILLDGVCTLNVCNVHHIQKKRVYYQLRVHCRNLSEYKGSPPVATRMKCSVSDENYDTDASVSVSQTGSEDGSTESDDFSESDE